MASGGLRGGRLLLVLLCLGLFARTAFAGLTLVANSVGSVTYGFPALSANGTRIAIATYDAGVYISKDSGASWTQKTGTPSIRWWCLTMSDDGLIIAGGGTVAGGYSGIVVSTDGGLTWYDRGDSSGYGDWTGIASSADGMKMAATAKRSTSPKGGGPNGSGGCVYMTTDGGTTWSKNLNVPMYKVSYDNGVTYTSKTSEYMDPASITGTTKVVYFKWMGVAASADFSILYIIPSGSPPGMHKSTDSGATWSPVTSAPSTNEYGSSIACSSDGTKIIVANQNSISISINGGSSWTSYFNAEFTSAATSGDFTKIAGAGRGGGGSITYPVTSIDGGANWVYHTEVTQAWYGKVRFSRDGSVFVATQEIGQVYTSGVPCALGTYGSSCVACPAGSITDTLTVRGASTCTACPPGYTNTASWLPCVATPQPSAQPTTLPTIYPTRPSAAPTLSPTFLEPDALYRTYHSGADCASTPRVYDLRFMHACLEPTEEAPYFHADLCTVHAADERYSVSRVKFDGDVSLPAMTCLKPPVAVAGVLEHNPLCRRAPDGTPDPYVRAACGTLNAAGRDVMLNKEQVVVSEFYSSKTCAPDTAVSEQRGVLLGGCHPVHDGTPANRLLYHSRLTFDAARSAADASVIALADARFRTSDCSGPPIETKTLTYPTGIYSSATQVKACAPDPLNPGFFVSKATHVASRVLFDPSLSPTTAPTPKPSPNPTVKPTPTPTSLPSSLFAVSSYLTTTPATLGSCTDARNVVLSGGTFCGRSVSPCTSSIAFFPATLTATFPSSSASTTWYALDLEGGLIKSVNVQITMSGGVCKAAAGAMVWYFSSASLPTTSSGADTFYSGSNQVNALATSDTDNGYGVKGLSGTVY